MKLWRFAVFSSLFLHTEGRVWPAHVESRNWLASPWAGGGLSGGLVGSPHTQHLGITITDEAMQLGEAVLFSGLLDPNWGRRGTGCISANSHMGNWTVRV